MLPQLLNIESMFDTSQVKAKVQRTASILSCNQATSTPVKLWSISNNDRLLIDAFELMNAIYEDMTQINEIVSIKKIQALVPEGVALFYKGFLIVNTLEPRYLSKVLMKCRVHRVFEEGSVPSQLQPEIFLDMFTFRAYQRRAKQEQAYRYVSLMEDVMQNHFMSRFEEQKKTNGERGYLDDSSSSETSEKDEKGKDKASDKSDDDDDDESDYYDESDDDKDKDADANNPTDKNKSPRKSPKKK